jgi:hypothetical protein
MATWLLNDDFQLPLSGSHYHHIIEVRDAEAFNSLSRDHLNFWDIFSGAVLFSLSTPSLGITDPTQQVSIASPKALAVFQLPLSGSPSPIPGFSGSPRLSAAAPLRTDEF